LVPFQVLKKIGGGFALQGEPWPEMINGNSALFPALQQN
jgi:hypothetical protein